MEKSTLLEGKAGTTDGDTEGADGRFPHSCVCYKIHWRGRLLWRTRVFELHLRIII